ncbi:unnamed protein product [Rotaria socialis]|uniref:CSD domain-containing protein n=1 Tax=Rotaria socialis TaxID=392032 RepID=A0A819WWX1_9BILA|nr:unnamed protein product [Rotaria socialis]CAF3480200.1 unnamed protein product [Rotaria socialis]CAF4133226.1 unnamed protein product [Rotaria socialis]CAF4459026.1 unnamed protein product [Rotaria socialis]
MTSVPTKLYHHHDHYQRGSNSKLLTTSMNTINTSDDMILMKVQRELGIIEKLCSTYGFVYCCHRDGRYFFHFSEYKNDIQQAKIGDVVEFETTIDKRKKKPVAVNIIPASSEIVGENRVEGTIAVVARLQQVQNEFPPFDFIPDGKVTYVKKGETYFLPYGLTDLQDSTVQVKVGDRVSFNVGQDRRTNQFFARNVVLLDQPIPSTSSTIKRYRGVISTMKDSFGFIEREDALKEIFFHITEFGPTATATMIQPGVEVEFDIQDRHNKEVASNIIILPKGTVEFDEIDKTPHIGRILQPLQNKLKKSENALAGRLIYDALEKKMSELPFGDRDRCGLYTLLDSDIVQFVIAKDKRDGMMRATQISLLDQSFLKSKEQRQIGIVIKLDTTIGGQIKYLSSDQIVSFRFSEVMKDNFQITEGDLLEFTLASNIINGDLPQAIRIKLIAKDSLTNINGHELRLMGIVERDANDARLERNGRSNEASETKQTNGNDTVSSSINNRQQEPGLIRYVHQSNESTIQYLSTNLSNTSALYYGDKVEFNITPGSKLALNVALIERNRVHGWIAILREGKGFIEQGTTMGSIEPVAFSMSSFTGDNIQVELGDEVEFSLRKISSRLVAENILKVSSTINNFYSILPTIHCGRVVTPVRMISNDECEVFGRIQKIADDGIPGECFTFSITGVKNKRVILLPNDSVTFSVAVGLDYSRRAVNIILENETRKGKVDTVKGQFGFIDFACEENKKIFFHNSEIESGIDLRAGDEVEFYAQYNLKSGKPCASRLRRVNNLQRPDRLITKLKSINFDENTRQKLVIIRQPRNADEKSKGFTSVRSERAPGVLIKAQN